MATAVAAPSARAAPSRPVATLGELLAEDDLGLRLVVGGEPALARPLAGAHVVEVEHPTRWLAPDWLMLTTGTLLRDRPGVQRRLVGELRAAGMCALAFGEGHAFASVPAALVQAARRSSFPLVSVPHTTPFREVVLRATTLAADGEPRELRRLTAMQRYLSDALTCANPRTVLVQRLAELLKASAVLFGPTGEIELSGGPPPYPGLWAGVDAHADLAMVREMRVGEWHAVVAPVRRRESPVSRFLVVATDRRGFSPRLARGATEAAALLLCALARVDDLGLHQRRSDGAALLERVLAAPPRELGEEHSRRMAEFGLDPRRGVQAAVVLAAPAARDRVRETLLERSELTGVPMVVTDRAAETLVASAAADGAPLPGMLDLARTGVHAGVGQVVYEIAALDRSVRQARLAAWAARRRGLPVAHFDGLDLPSLVIGQADPGALEVAVASLRDGLAGHADLLDSLRTYFEADFDVATAARALHVHPNTLRYRLSRVEQLIGRPLRTPATVAAVHLMLLIDTAASAPR